VFPSIVGRPRHQVRYFSWKLVIICLFPFWNMYIFLRKKLLSKTTH
jgi:hypothetical protein